MVSPWTHGVIRVNSHTLPLDARTPPQGVTYGTYGVRYVRVRFWSMNEESLGTGCRIPRRADVGRVLIQS